MTRGSVIHTSLCTDSLEFHLSNPYIARYAATCATSWSAANCADTASLTLGPSDKTKWKEVNTGGVVQIIGGTAAELAYGAMPSVALCLDLFKQVHF